MDYKITKKNSVFARVKNFFISSSKDIKTLTLPKITGDSTTKTSSLRDFEISFLSEIYTLTDKAALVRTLLEALPEDLDYNYFDGGVDNTSSGLMLAYTIALEVFEDLPDDADLLNTLCYSFLVLGDYERSLHCSLKLVEQNPDDGVMWGNIAWCQMKLGKFKEALKSSERALRLLPNVPNVYDTHVAILAGMGKIDEAISVAGDAIADVAINLPELNYQLGMLFERKGDMKKASVYWCKYLQIVKDRYGHRNAVARVHNKLLWSVYLPGFIKGSRVDLLTRMMLAHLLCLSLFGKAQKALTEEQRKGMSETKFQIGHFIETICASYGDIVKVLLSSRPKREKAILAQHLNLISLAYLLQERLENVEEWLKGSFSLAPKNLDSKMLLYAYYILKVFKGVSEDEEYKLLQAALRLNPKPCHTHILLARYYCGKRAFGKVEKICADVENGESKYKFLQWEREIFEEAKFGTNLWLGVARLIQGRDREALRILSNLHEKRPKVYEVKYFLVTAYLRNGDITAAIEIFESIPPGALPENVYDEIRALLRPKSAGIANYYEEALLGSIRSPRMTGCSSSPITSRG